ncbi:hypothetical protein [Inquilinus limosus]|uniref:hypothetical protein n=1 Tax=Inquilinus limosus TaxID=171674 RepID=UPI00041140CA|nr:hypothetical protein [Inquilinus limosus]
MADANPTRRVALVAMKYRGQRFEIGDPLPDLSEADVSQLGERIGPASANASRKGKAK